MIDRRPGVAAVLVLVLSVASCGSMTTDAATGSTSTTDPLPTTEAPIVDLTSEPDEPETTTTTEAGPVLYRGDDDPPDPAQVAALGDRPFADQIKVFALGGEIHGVRGFRSQPGFLQLFRFDPDEQGWLELPTVQVTEGQPLHIDTFGGTLRVSLVGARSVAEGTRTYLTQDLANWIEIGTGAFEDAPDDFTSSIIPVRNSSLLMEFGPADDEPVTAKQLVRFDGVGFERTPIPHSFNWYGGVAGGILTTEFDDPTRGRFTTDGVEWTDVRLSAARFASPTALFKARTFDDRLYVPEVVEGVLLLHVSDDLGRTWTTSTVGPLAGDVGSMVLASGPSGVALAVGTPSALVLFSPDGMAFEVVGEVDAIDDDDALGPVRSLAVGTDHIAYSVDEWGVLPVVLPLG